MCHNAFSEKMLAQHHGGYCFVTLKHPKHLDLHHLRHLISSHKLKLLLRNIVVLSLDTTQYSAWTSSYKLVDSRLHLNLQLAKEWPVRKDTSVKRAKVLRK